MMKRTAKILLGIAFLPLCIGFTWQFGATLFGINYKPGVPYYFLAGILAYCAVHILFKKPIFSYVFGHELTHALFAVLFGGSIRSFQASERGGRVTVTKSNFLITLAPYFFPLYTCIALILYGLAAASNATAVAGWFVFLAGATFSFHLMLTFIFLRTEQSDIHEQGAVFSFPLIYLFNILFAAFLIHLLLAKDADFLAFLLHGIMKSIGVASQLLSRMYAVVRSVL